MKTESISLEEKFYSGGQIKSRSYINADEILHRDPKEGPAYENWYSNGQVSSKKYYLNGNLHRDPKEGPAYESWYENGEIAFQLYYVDGKEVPATKVKEEMKEVIKPEETFYPDGKVKLRTYRNTKGNLHRDPKEGPAYEQWYEDWQILRQEYWVDGKLHRDPKEGPAIQTWYDDGMLECQAYYTDGDFHRDPKEGPAYKILDRNGQIKRQFYYADRVRLSEPEESIKPVDLELKSIDEPSNASIITSILAVIAIGILSAKKTTEKLKPIHSENGIKITQTV